MDIIKADIEGVTLSFSERELTHLLSLVQKGRAALECSNPTGQELDEGLRAAAG